MGGTEEWGAGLAPPRVVAVGLLLASVLRPALHRIRRQVGCWECAGGSPAPRAMEELVEKLEVLEKPVGARERRAELTARRLAQVAVRVVRPLTRAIRAGATTDGVEAALVETVEVALTFYYMSRGIEGE